MHARSSILTLVIVGMPWLGVGPTSADELAYQWEADVFPHDESAGWQVFALCNLDCVESLEDGHFILEWSPEASDDVNFNLEIGGPPVPRPPTLWVEWRFKSNQEFPPQEPGCDGIFVVIYDALADVVWLHGDAAVSFSFDDVLSDLELDAFHTYRYEGISGDRHRISVDGHVFTSRLATNSGEYDRLQFGGFGSCNRPPKTGMRNEWDFIRYGTMSEGEAIVSSIPAEGIVDANANPNFDRFTIVFDQPGYVYVDDVTIAVTGGPIPIVIKTRRAENHGPDTLEVVLDRPLTLGETTTFTFATGGTPNTVAYTYLSPGACCDGLNEICTIETQADCEAAGFVYGGDGTDCATVEPPCECIGNPPDECTDCTEKFGVGTRHGQVALDGVVDNGDGTTTYSYRVCQDASSQAISHWILGLSQQCCNNIVSASGGTLVLPCQVDPTTGLFGLKFDDIQPPDCDASCMDGGSSTGDLFSVTLSNAFSTTCVKTVCKIDGDPASAFGCLQGPTCKCVPDCTGKECGDDSCGGTCGTCQPCPEACDASGVCQSTCGNNVCEPSCDETCVNCSDCACISPCERCVNGICVDVCGACCFEDEGCIDNVTSETCAERGGDEFHLRRTCDDRDGNGIADICDVPAVSIWCMVVLVLLLLAGMTIKFDQRIGLSDGG